MRNIPIFGNGLTDKILNIDSDTKVAGIIGILELLSNDYLNFERKLKLEVDNPLES